MFKLPQVIHPARRQTSRSKVSEMLATKRRINWELLRTAESQLPQTYPPPAQTLPPSPPAPRCHHNLPFNKILGRRAHLSLGSLRLYCRLDSESSRVFVFCLFPLYKWETEKWEGTIKIHIPLFSRIFIDERQGQILLSPSPSS